MAHVAHASGSSSRLGRLVAALLIYGRRPWPQQWFASTAARTSKTYSATMAACARSSSPSCRCALRWPAAPRSPRRRSPRPRQSAAVQLATPQREESKAADGVTYRKYYLKTTRGGMHVHTVQIEPLASFALMPVIANDQLNTDAPVSKLAKQVGAVAAINGGFFDTGKTRLPVGLVKIKRRIIFEQFLNRAVLGIDEQGQLHFDTLPAAQLRLHPGDRRDARRSTATTASARKAS